MRESFGRFLGGRAPTRCTTGGYCATRLGLLCGRRARTRTRAGCHARTRAGDLLLGASQAAARRPASILIQTVPPTDLGAFPAQRQNHGRRPAPETSVIDVLGARDLAVAAQQHQFGARSVHGKYRMQLQPRRSGAANATCWAGVMFCSRNTSTFCATSAWRSSRACSSLMGWRGSMPETSTPMAGEMRLSSIPVLLANGHLGAGYGPTCLRNRSRVMSPKRCNHCPSGLTRQALGATGRPGDRYRCRLGRFLSRQPALPDEAVGVHMARVVSSGARSAWCSQRSTSPMKSRWSPSSCWRADCGTRRPRCSPRAAARHARSHGAAYG